MTKIAILADLHGNMPATLAVEKEIERIRPNEVWFLGDCVGKGPQSDLTLDWVRKHCDHFVGGNWDYGIAEDRSPEDNYYCKQLGEERLAWLRSLPREAELVMSGICFRLFHGRPVTELIFGSDDDEKLNRFFDTPTKTYGGFICADCHRPSVRMTERGYAINTGSIGNSLGIPKAQFLLLEGEKDSMEPAPLHISTLCIPYDNAAAAEIAKQYPDLPFCESYRKEVMTGIYSR